MLDEQQARERVVELEARLAELEALPESETQSVAFAAVEALMDVYGTALGRIVDLAPQLAADLAADELIAHLLFLHGLHPVPVQARVEAALQSVRPYLATHGGNVELLSVGAGVATVRLQGTCHGCPSSTATLKQAIEEAVFKAAPDVERITAEGVAEPNLISLEELSCPLPVGRRA